MLVVRNDAHGEAYQCFLFAFNFLVHLLQIQECWQIYKKKTLGIHLHFYVFLAFCFSIIFYCFLVFMFLFLCIMIELFSFTLPIEKAKAMDNTSSKI